MVGLAAMPIAPPVAVTLALFCALSVEVAIARVFFGAIAHEIVVLLALSTAKVAIANRLRHRHCSAIGVT